jgi:hypothetical protein
MHCVSAVFSKSMSRGNGMALAAPGYNENDFDSCSVEQDWDLRYLTL